MTGYGKSEAQLENGKLTVEIRSVNGKNADISIKTSLLPKDREMGIRKKIAESLRRSCEAVRDEQRSSNEECTGACRLAGFLDSIHGAAAREAVPTGYRDLDEQLDGGLFAGLYILGAVSSLG